MQKQGEENEIMILWSSEKYTTRYDTVIKACKRLVQHKVQKRMEN